MVGSWFVRVWATLRKQENQPVIVGKPSPCPSVVGCPDAFGISATSVEDENDCGGAWPKVRRGIPSKTAIDVVMAQGCPTEVRQVLVMKTPSRLGRPDCAVQQYPECHRSDEDLVEHNWPPDV
jgi:hypothetical protein